jgi:hypothetical protein
LRNSEFGAPSSPTCIARHDRVNIQSMYVYILNKNKVCSASVEKSTNPRVTFEIRFKDQTKFKIAIA